MKAFSTLRTAAVKRDLKVMSGATFRSAPLMVNETLWNEPHSLADCV